MSGDLLFRRAPTGPDLVFGDDDGIVQGAATATLDADFDPLLLSAVAVEPLSASMDADFGELPAQVSASYDHNVSRPVVGERLTAWQAAQPLQAARGHAWKAMDRVMSSARASWQGGRPVQGTTACAWSALSRVRSGAAARWQGGARLRAGATLRWQDATHTRYGAASRWQDASRVRTGRLSRWQDMDHSRRLHRESRWQDADPLHTGRQTRTGTAVHLPFALRTRWQDAIVPPPGISPRPTEPGVTPHQPDANLVFCHYPAGPDLVFGAPCDYTPQEPQQPGHIVPVRRTYIVLDSVSLRRLDSSVEVGALSVDISIDRSSWVCSWSAAVPANEWPALAAKAGEPLEIEAVINGRRWVLLMEGHPSRTRAFGEVAVKISGRGHAAWLSAPYAPSESRMPATDMTAQQLMALALTTNGASLGWTIDWQVTDWLVPAGAWSHFGSPIDGLLDVAGTISATVQADASAKIIHVLPRYPAAPWELESLAPDIEIPVDALDGDSFEPIVLPAYNAVYLSGQTHGVIGHVTRRGTAGDLQADMITHPLMTSVEAVRQRGIAELGNTGRQARVSITLDISDDMPLLAVGQVSSFPEAGDPWRGVVAGVSVSATMDGDALVVSQRAEIERFFPEAV